MTHGVSLDPYPDDLPSQTDFLDDDDLDCTLCVGDGWEECGDPIQCTRHHHLGEHPCPACDGSGLRSKQTVF